jgi:hypothetical protein
MLTVLLRCGAKCGLTACTYWRCRYQGEIPCWWLGRVQLANDNPGFIYWPRFASPLHPPKQASKSEQLSNAATQPTLLPCLPFLIVWANFILLPRTLLLPICSLPSAPHRPWHCSPAQDWGLVGQPRRPPCSRVGFTAQAFMSSLSEWGRSQLLGSPGDWSSRTRKEVTGGRGGARDMLISMLSERAILPEVSCCRASTSVSTVLSLTFYFSVL